MYHYYKSSEPSCKFSTDEATACSSALACNFSGSSLAKSTLIVLPDNSVSLVAAWALVASSGFANSTNPNPLLLLVSLSRITLANTTSPYWLKWSLNSCPLKFQSKPHTNSLVLLIISAMQMHINKIKGSYNLSATQRNHRHNLAFLKQLKYVYKNNIDIINQNTNDFNNQNRRKQRGYFYKKKSNYLLYFYQTSVFPYWCFTFAHTAWKNSSDSSHYL